MKTTIFKFIGVMAVGLSLAQAVQASQMSGTIGFTGRVVLNTGTASTASQVIAWLSPTVNGTSGDFGSVANGTSVNMINATPWSFVSGSVTAFWQVGGFSFDLIGSSVLSQGGVAGTTGFVNVTGTGTVSGNGFDPTTIIWNFSTQDPAIRGNPDSFTFSMSHVATPTRVPDGGLTVAAFALALTGTALLRKKLAA
jgi:hypothetical protein